MKPNEHIDALNNLLQRFTTFPSKTIHKHLKVILAYQNQLTQDNKRLRKKNKRLNRKIKEGKE